ncbi:unnamed protein product [Penicillium manginii]
MEPQSDDGAVPPPATAMGASLQNENSIPQSRSTESNSKSGPQRSKKLNKDRKRVSKACDNCSHRKVKCDGNVPCMQCLLRGRSCEAKRFARRLKGPSSIQDKCEKLWSSFFPEMNSERHLQSGPDLMPCQTDPSLGQNETQSAADTAHLLSAMHADQSEWDIYFETFCKNAYPQYPNLDLPTLRSRFENVSELLSLSLSFDSASKEYQAEISQTTILMAVYLSFVDETIRARRLLSIAILQLYSMDCRQSDMIDSKSTLKDENIRRALCCSYVLERELGLESKDSLIIPDSTVGEILKMDFGCYRLFPRQSETASMSAPQLERDVYLTTNDSVSASHIMAMTLHAQATSKVWGELHRDAATKSGIDHFLAERLEMFVEGAHNIVKARQKQMKN